ncbi:hypothetical protein, partial [Paraburkholderia tropica]|uniref:hypothetical protein n=1 Tax=Paraburkholderia tropica TaxID=92647 RepID=UPI001C859648
MNERFGAGEVRCGSHADSRLNSMRATLCNARESASGQFRSFDIVARIVDNKCLRHRDYLSPMRRLQASRFYIAGGSAEPAFILDGA